MKRILSSQPAIFPFQGVLGMDNGCGKRFAVIGNMNAIIYKEVFLLIKSNRIWLGATNFNVGLLIEFQGYAGTRVLSTVVVTNYSL